MYKKWGLAALLAMCVLGQSVAGAESCGQRVWKNHALREAAHGVYTRKAVADGGYWRDPALLPQQKLAPPTKRRARSAPASAKAVQAAPEKKQLAPQTKKNVEPKARPAVVPSRQKSAPATAKVSQDALYSAAPEDGALETRQK